MHVYKTLYREAASAYFSFRWWTCKIRRNHFEETQSHPTSSMSFSIYNGTKILSTKQERQTTILGWLNIFWSKYETHAYKENMLYRHALKEMLLAYLSNINDATFPTLDLSRDRERNDLQFEELYYYISFTLSTLSIYHLIYTKSSS